MSTFGPFQVVFDRTKCQAHFGMSQMSAIYSKWSNIKHYDQPCFISLQAQTNLELYCLPKIMNHSLIFYIFNDLLNHILLNMEIVVFAVPYTLAVNYVLLNVISECKFCLFAKLWLLLTSFSSLKSRILLHACWPPLLPTTSLRILQNPRYNINSSK